MLKKLFLYSVVIVSMPMVIKPMQQLEIPHKTVQCKLTEYDADLEKIGWYKASILPEFFSEMADLERLTKVTTGLGFMKNSTNLSQQDQEKITMITKKLERCKRNVCKNMKQIKSKADKSSNKPNPSIKKKRKR